MRCPFCSNVDSQVKDSRHTEDNTAIRRRRICDQCGSNKNINDCLCENSKNESKKPIQLN